MPRLLSLVTAVSLLLTGRGVAAAEDPPDTETCTNTQSGSDVTVPADAAGAVADHNPNVEDCTDEGENIADPDPLVEDPSPI